MPSKPIERGGMVSGAETSSKPGKFITLEGGEGVGKSTNLAFVENYLRSQGCRVVLTREPGGTPLAEKIRGLLLEKSAEPVSDLAELLMMFAARAQHLEQVIRPALARGDWVVCDRFTDATYAYQGYGRGMDKALIAKLEQMVHPGFQPDLTLLLDIDVEEGLARALDRSEPDRIESEQRSFFEAVRNGYLELSQAHPERFAVVDASPSLEAVQSTIKNHLDRMIEVS